MTFRQIIRAMAHKPKEATPNLRYVFSSGQHRFYEYHSIGDMGLDRLERLEYWQLLLRTRMDENEYKGLHLQLKSLFMDINAADGKEPRAKLASKGIWLCEEIERRVSEEVIPASVLFHFMADTFIREDEVGKPFNLSVSQQKFDWFWANRHNLGDFFPEANTKEYLPIFDIGSFDLRMLLARWEVETVRMEEALALTKQA